MITTTCRYSLTSIAVALALTACGGQAPEKSIAAAKASLAKGDDKAAVIELKGVLQKEPSLAEARFLLGSALIAGGNMRDALIELSKAKELGYSPAALAPKMARAMVGLGQFDKVIAEFATTQLEAPSDKADLQISVASAYASLGKGKEAQERIAAALAAEPGNLRAEFARVRFLASFQNLAAALAAIDEVLAKSPRSAEGWQIKGDLLNYGGQRDEAVTAFRKSLELDNTSVAAHTGLLTQLLLKKDLAAAEKELEALKKVKPDVLVARRFTAALALEKGDLKAATENIQEVLKVTPNDINVLHMAGAIEFRRNNLRQAEAHLSKALSEASFIPGIRLLLARTYARGGDRAKALHTLQPLLDDPGSKLDALGIAAEVALQQGDAERASGYLREALKLNPGDKRSQTAMAYAQVGKGNVEQGLAELKRISAESPDFTLPDMLLVTTYLQRNRLDQALAAVDVLQKKTPKEPMAPNLRGVIELRLGHSPAARKAFEAAVANDPVYLPAVASLAALDRSEGNIESAIGRYKALLALQPDNIAANMAVLALEEQRGTPVADRAELLKKLIKRLPQEVQPRVALVKLELERNEPKAALAVAQDAAAALPDRAEVWTALGRAQMGAGDFNQAVSAFNKVAAMQPGSPEPMLRLAELYLGRKDKASAVQHLKKALNIQEDYLPAQLALASMHLESKNYAEGRSLAKLVQKQRPNEAVGAMLEGDVESTQKNWAAAITSYQAGLARSGAPELAIKLHKTLLSAGKAAEAKKLQDDWLAKNPSDTMMLFYLGNAASRAQDYDLAEKHYQAVVKIRPDHAQALNNLGWVTLQLKKPGALQYAEKATALMPNEPAYLDTLAEIYASEGKLNKAIEIQRRAVALTSHTPAQRLHLARLYIDAGNKAAAREELSKLAELGFQFAQQAEVSKLLSEL